MSSQFYQIITFKLKPGVTPKQYAEKYKPVLEKVLKSNPDFVSNRHFYDPNKPESMINYVVWKSFEGAKRGNEENMSSPIAGQWFSLMEEGSIQISDFKELEV